MADRSDHGSDGSHMFDFTGLFSDDVDGILAKHDTMQRCDLIDQLTDDLDMSTLMDIREKAFRFAKRKLVKSVEEPGDMDIDPDFADKSVAGRPGVVDEWTLIARKGKTCVAMDVVELMSYPSKHHGTGPVLALYRLVPLVPYTV